MGTRIFGCSDDLIEFEGDIQGETGDYGTDEREHGVLLVFSDGTLLEVKYGKGRRAIWGISLVSKGTLFVGIEQCTNEDAEIYSDIATFQTGLSWAYAAHNWEPVK